MKMSTKLLALGLSTSMLAAAPAYAASYLFSYAGQNGTDSAFFSIDSNPTPSNYSNDKGFFQISNVLGLFSAGGVTTNLANIEFFLRPGVAQAGGFELDGGSTGNSFLNVAGLQLFTGTLDAPMFKIGTFELRGGTLNISGVAADVPEPATWVMMLVGFGMMAAMMRRRSKQTVRVTYA